MESLNIQSVTESEEMYLITIAHLGEMGQAEPISLSKIAKALKVQPTSANQMIRKMENEGLLEYIPYKGVRLQPIGRQWAQRVLRYRRLWEVFFVSHLKLPLNEADELACHMEHITPENVGEQLSTYLEHPMHSPQGYLIPGTLKRVEHNLFSSLSATQPGNSIHIYKILNESTKAFLKNEGIEENSQITILAIGQQGNMLLEFKDIQLQLSKTITDQILVCSDKANE